MSDAEPWWPPEFKRYGYYNEAVSEFVMHGFKGTVRAYEDGQYAVHIRTSVPVPTLFANSRLELRAAMLGMSERVKRYRP